MEKSKSSCSWWECKLAQPLWKRVWQFLEWLNIELLHDFAIPLLPGIDSTEMKTYPNWNLYGKTAPMSSTDEWINTVCYIHKWNVTWPRKKWSMDTCYAWTKAEKWKKSSADDHILCDRASVKWPEHKVCRDRK